MPQNQQIPNQPNYAGQPNPGFQAPGAVPPPAPTQPPSVVTTPSPQPKKSKDRNPLTIVVILLCLLLMLAIGAIITLLLLNNNNTNELNQSLTQNIAEVDRQRNDKNAIRDIWEEEAASNDKLIVSQDNVITQLQDYINEVSKTFRFVDGQAQTVETADKTRYDNALEDLNAELENLRLDSQDAIDKKAANKTKIEEIYLNSFEDQNNRANPDGIR